MTDLTALDQFDLATQGDRHEKEFWPLLARRFPSYEILWRRLIVPLTNRVDPAMSDCPETGIRLRNGVPELYEQMSMAHYSAFYFLGRAAKRLSEEQSAFEYPEDVLFLLDSVGDNCKRFLQTMNRIGQDCGQPVFGGSVTQFPKGFDPFKEISDYRDTFLHNTVIGRGIGVGKIYVPKWHIERSVSPLERAKRSWREAECIPFDDLVCTKDLLERLISDACGTLEGLWQTAINVINAPAFYSAFIEITGLGAYFPLRVQPVPWAPFPGASGNSMTLGSNATYVVRPGEGALPGRISPGGRFHK